MFEEPSFCLDLRVKDEIHQLSICLSDSKQSLLAKLEKIYPNCANKSSESLEKIKHQLQVIIRSEKVQTDLREAVEFFFINNFQSTAEIDTECHISDFPMQSRAKSCFSEAITPVKRSISKAIQTECSPEKMSI